MRNRGGSNRRTGKTTRRNKVKTHWGRKAPAGRAARSERKAKVRNTSGPKA